MLNTNRKDQATDKTKEKEAVRSSSALRLALERRSEHVHNSSKHSAISLIAHQQRLSTENQNRFNCVQLPFVSSQSPIGKFCQVHWDQWAITNHPWPRWGVVNLPLTLLACQLPLAPHYSNGLS